MKLHQIASVLFGSMILLACTSSASADPCDRYVRCVCDLAEVADGAGGSTAQLDCSAIRAMYSTAGTEVHGMCQDMLDGVKAMRGTYDQLGVEFPASCQ